MGDCVTWRQIKFTALPNGMIFVEVNQVNEDTGIPSTIFNGQFYEPPTSEWIDRVMKSEVMGLLDAIFPSAD